MARTQVPNNIQLLVEIKSKRRCALCYGLENDLNFKLGQIAHLDGNNSNNDFDNLCYLCMDHHNLLDARFRQTKGIYSEEVKHYRDDLYLINDGKKLPPIMNRDEIEVFLKMVSPFIEFLVTTDLDLGYMIPSDFLIKVESFLNYWPGYKITLQTRQLVNLAEEFVLHFQNLFFVFDNNYVNNGYVLTFKWNGKSEHDDVLLTKKKNLVNGTIKKMIDVYKTIKELIY